MFEGWRSLVKAAPITNQGIPAFDVRGVPNEVRVYMQTKTLAGEEEPQGFFAALNAFRQNFAERPLPDADMLGRFIELTGEDENLTPDTCKTVRARLQLCGFSDSEIDFLLTDYSWKTARLPAGPKNILSTGCGGGAELVFLRSLYPQARIVALDYVRSLRGGDNLLRQLDVEFKEGDIFKNIETLDTKFDLIFSNHVIEHFYEPEEQLSALVRLLNPRGIFAAGLPLDGHALADLMRRLARSPRSIHALDMNWLDVRHPWKTNRADLAATLIAAGLGDVEVYQRAYHSSRALPISAQRCEERERSGRLIYGLTLGAFVRAIRLIVGENVPRRLARLVFALDRRLWFGLYRLKTEVQPEVFVMARRP
jgi:SAM-dependent methyltransferase